MSTAHDAGAQFALDALITLQDVQRAADILAPVAVRTPLVRGYGLDHRLIDRAALKAESLQRGGAFKFRGAFYYVACLDPEVRQRGLVAPSSGNHARAVALAGRLFGVPVTAVMPTTVTHAKYRGTKVLGAEIVLAGTTTDDRMVAAVEIARKTGAVVVPPYDDHRVVAGHATCGLEILQDAPDVSTVLVPVGGGGLAAGVAAIVKQLRPTVRVIAVEPVGAATLTRALKKGSPTLLDSVSSLADGLLPLAIGAVPFLHLRRFVDEVVLVEDADIAGAMRVIFDEFHLVAEPSGAAAFAALLSGRVTATGNVVSVLSGGNIEAEDLAGILIGRHPETSRLDAEGP